MALILRGKDIKTKHLKFIDELSQEAKKCPNGTPHVACLIFNNKMVSKGHSTFKSHITDKVKDCLLRGLINSLYMRNKTAFQNIIINIILKIVI